jgi:hypothetical protein
MPLIDLQKSVCRKRASWRSISASSYGEPGADHAFRHLALGDCVDYLRTTIRTARADGRPVNSTSTANPLCSSSVHAPICASTGLFVLISHENWCLGLP